MKSKAALFIGFLFICSFASYCKNSDKGEFLIGAKFDQSQFLSKRFMGAGIALEYFLNKRVSVQYSLLAGEANGGNYYWFAGAGQAGGYYAISSSNNQRLKAGGIVLAIFAFAVPEAFNFNMDVKDKFRFTLFMSPFGFEYTKDKKSPTEEFFVSFEYGLKGYSLKRASAFRIIPQLGLKSLYTRSFNEVAFTFGVSLMYHKQPNKERELKPKERKNID